MRSRDGIWLTVVTVLAVLPISASADDARIPLRDCAVVTNVKQNTGPYAMDGETWIRVRNQCAQTVWAKFCILGENGRWDCGGDELRGGAETSYWSAHATTRTWVCAHDDSGHYPCPDPDKLGGQDSAPTDSSVQDANSLEQQRQIQQQHIQQQQTEQQRLLQQQIEKQILQQQELQNEQRKQQLQQQRRMLDEARRQTAEASQRQQAQLAEKRREIDRKKQAIVDAVNAQQRQLEDAKAQINNMMQGILDYYQKKQLEDNIRELEEKADEENRRLRAEERELESEAEKAATGGSETYRATPIENQELQRQLAAQRLETERNAEASGILNDATGVLTEANSVINGAREISLTQSSGGDEGAGSSPNVGAAAHPIMSAPTTQAILHGLIPTVVASKDDRDTRSAPAPSIASLVDRALDAAADYADRKIPIEDAGNIGTKAVVKQAVDDLLEHQPSALKEFVTDHLASIMFDKLIDKAIDVNTDWDKVDAAPGGREYYEVSRAADLFNLRKGVYAYHKQVMEKFFQQLDAVFPPQNAESKP